MATHRYQVALQHTSLLPRDQAINVMYFDTGGVNLIGAGSPEEACNGIAAAYESKLKTMVNGAYSGIVIKVYNLTAPGVPAGAPRLVKTYGFGPVSIDGPCEIALCLSYSADDDAAGTKRRRGRLYIPWKGNDNRMRPTVAHVAAVLDFGEELAKIGTADGITWKMYSPTNNTTHTIESISCDNEWDTQRRRGLRATTRVRRDVQ